jgi:hypothetical protein
VFQKYYHKTKDVILRSLKTAKKYDEDGTLPIPKRKSKSKTKENEIIHAEKEVSTLFFMFNNNFGVVVVH